MIEPVKAAVRPRVHVETSREPVLLEEFVAEMNKSGSVRAIAINGAPGWGITTALQHLAHVFGTDSGLRFVDRVRPSGRFEPPKEAPGGILFPQPSLQEHPIVVKCTLAKWSRDEWIEYLLATHRTRCQSVMRRVLNDADMESLDGNPSILRLVLDELAADENLSNVKSAIRRLIERRFPDVHKIAENAHKMAEIAPLVMSLVSLNAALPLTEAFAAFSAIGGVVELSDEQSRLLICSAIQLQLATDLIWRDLLEQAEPDRFLQKWPRSLVDSVAKQLAETPVVWPKLQGWINSGHHKILPRAVSLLHAAGAPWELPHRAIFSSPSRRMNLEEAILDGADCTLKVLSNCNLNRASFEEANLLGVDLQQCTAYASNFSRADMRQTNLTDFNGTFAKFGEANLSHCHGCNGIFQGANFSNACLTDARLNDCNFDATNLAGADLRRARLQSSTFNKACLDQADFRYANCRQAYLKNLDLTVAEFEGANFRSAMMVGCQLEGMRLPDANFASASLAGAVLTGSFMQRANFRGADLRFAKLAEVDWESADLRSADLTGATFHMGSSRSGLVGSSIPLLGSRTGFYTDEFNEQDFKSPEEIRSANLRGADLRDAIIDDVDFYLVDLRDAFYDEDQAEQLRTSGAILEARTRD